MRSSTEPDGHVAGLKPPTNVGRKHSVPARIESVVMSEQSSARQDASDAPTCTLDEDGRRQRADWAREEVFSHYREGELLDAGFAATFDASEESLTALASLVARESACCAALTFELVYEPPYETAELRLTGPEGTRELLEQGIVEEFERVSDAS